MEPFTIQCTTCQSKIRVKNPKMVGQLANCPKCDSMIMIAAPAPEVETRQVQVSGGAGPVDSMAMTKDGMVPDFQPELHEPPTPPTPPEDYRLAPLEEPISESDFEEEPAESDWQPAEEPLVPTQGWESESTNKTRQLLLVGFLGLGSLALTTVLFFLFMNWYRSSGDSEKAALGQGAVQGVVESTEGESESLSNQSEPELEQGNQPSVVEDPDSLQVPNSEQEFPGAEPANPPSEPEPVDPEGPLALPPSLVDDGTNAETPAEVGTEGEATDLEAALAAADPLEQIRTQMPNASFRAMTRGILDFEMQLIPTHEDVLSGPPPVTAGDLNLATGITRTPVPDVNLSDRLQVPLPGIMFSDSMTLAAAINSWTQITGVPTSVDLNSLAVIDVDVSQSPEVLIQNSTIAEAADQFAGAIGAQMTEQENRFFELSATSEQLRAAIPAEFPLQGLVGDDLESAEWLIGALSHLYSTEPEAWKVENGKLGFEPTKVSLLEWLQVVRLLESWRAQLSLGPAYDSYTQARMVNQFVTPDRVDGLETVLPDVQYSLQAEPVADVLSRICAAGGITCWIDWSVVGRNGLGPNTTRLVYTHRRKLKHALADIADIYGLEFAIVDEKTLWVSTVSGYRLRPSFYVLPSEGRTPEQLQQLLRLLTPIDSEGIREVVVLPTPDGKNFLVRCCPPHVMLP